MLPYVCSVLDHRWLQNVVKTKKWHTSRRRVCHWCFYHILTSSVIYYWTDPRQHGIYLFYTMNRNEKWQTCLVLLDYSTICASLGVFQITNAIFRLYFLFSSLSFLYTVLRNVFQRLHLLKEEYSEKILQNCESLVAMTHDGNCCEDSCSLGILKLSRTFLSPFLHFSSM